MGKKNKDKPRKRNHKFFKNVLKDHDKVRKFEKEAEQIYKIIRNRGDKIIVYLTNLYTIGIADYHDIIENHSNVNAIVTASNWNSYTRDAKETAKDNKIGIYVIEEFLGALNHDEPHNYVKKDDKGSPVHYWRRGTTR